MYDVDVCGRSYHSDTMQRQYGENITIQLDLKMPERTTRVTPRANKNSPVTSQSHSIIVDSCRRFESEVTSAYIHPKKLGMSKFLCRLRSLSR